MRNIVVLAIIIISICDVTAQRGNQARRDSLNRLTQIDHQDMMDKLGIKKLRGGANGRDPEAPNAANYDEAKANPYPTLPDPLLLNNRESVTSADVWWEQRRPEIVEAFDREVYGRMPENIPGVDWEIVNVHDSIMFGVSTQTKSLIGKVDNRMFPKVSVNIDLRVTVPKDAAGPVPIIMSFTFGRRFGRARPANAGPTWQDQVLAKGWGYAVLVPNSIQADNGAGLTNGIIGLMNKGERRSPDDWGALRAWAWGASRALDYFESDPQTDATRVAIQGHSRYGKAAIVTLAYDDRFATGYISSSGAGGAKLHRRNAGEIVENVAGTSEYHWMAGNYIKYAGPLNWGDLPVDAHQLVALCAPRPIFISSGEKGDGWVDARGMFMAGVQAGPVYKLLGKKDLGTDVFPPVETGIMKGEISFRQHSSGHTPGPNWPVFLDFAARYF